MRALRDDAEARAAARRWLRERVKQFAWYWERRGRRWAATVTYVRGAGIARDPGLLARLRTTLRRPEGEEPTLAGSSAP